MEDEDFKEMRKHGLESQQSMGVDEEDQYLKALNASLLIQTPLQVTLEVIQKRLRKQAKNIESLKQKLQEQDTSVVDSRNLLERMQSVEQGLMNLKTSKLSPFTQSEVLDRLEQLEKKMKEQRIQFETHLEKEAMKKQMAENKLSESFIDAPSPKESISASLEISQPSTPSPQPLEDRSAVVLTEESKATDLSDSCSTSKELERALQELNLQLVEMRSRLGSYEAVTTNSFSNLKDQLFAWNQKNQEDFRKIKQEISGIQQIPYCEFEVLKSKIEVFEQNSSQHHSLLNHQEVKYQETVEAVKQDLKALRKDVQSIDRRTEAALSAALSGLESSTSKEGIKTRSDYAHVSQIEEVREQLQRQPTLSDIEQLIREEVGKLQWKQEAKIAKEENSVQEKVQPGRATRFTCLSCDRALDPYRPEPVGDLPSPQGLLPQSQDFKTRTIFNLQPIGPGLNAAELRKLQFISEKPDSLTSSPKQSKVTPRDLERHKNLRSTTPLFL